MAANSHALPRYRNLQNPSFGFTAGLQGVYLHDMAGSDSGYLLPL
jgi:hypothetical protein